MIWHLLVRAMVGPVSGAEERGVVVDFFFGKVDGLGANAIRRADDVNVYMGL